MSDNLHIQSSGTAGEFFSAFVNGATCGQFDRLVALNNADKLREIRENHHNAAYQAGTIIGTLPDEVLAVYLAGKFIPKSLIGQLATLPFSAVYILGSTVMSAYDAEMPNGPAFLPTIFNAFTHSQKR